MKRFFQLCLALLLVSMSNVLCYAQVRTFEKDGINYRVIKEPDGSIATGTVSVCRLEYGEYEGDIVIPNVVKESDDQYADKYKVVGIDEESFDQSKYLKSVKLPPSIEFIGDNAFRLSSVEKVDIPMGNLTSLGRYVFAQTKLFSIEIPSSVKTIGEYAFYECSRLPKEILHEGLNVIEAKAFKNCYQLESIVLPNSNKFIGEGAFQDCYMLSKISLGSGLKGIGDNAFDGCIRLRHVELPEGLRGIGKEAFANSGIVDVTIPKSIKVIKESCFANSMLRRIALPSTLIQIEDLAFFRCRLDTLNYSTNTKVAADVLMTATEWRATMGDTLTRGTFYVPERGKELDLLISELEKNISRADVLSVDYANVVFGGSGSMKIGDLMYSPMSYPIKGETYGTLVLVGGKSASGNVKIPAVIEIIGGPYPEKYIVAGIESAAFDGNQKVLSVVIPPCVSAYGIGMSAFRGTGITEFSIPEYMEVIPSGLLFGSNLSTITLPKKLKKIGALAFSETKLKKIVIPEGVVEIEDGSFSKCNYLSVVSLPSTVRIIGEDAFLRCPISKIILPESIEEIGRDCFYGCLLENLRVPKGLKKIGRSAFGCESLKYVEISGNPCNWLLDGYGTWFFGNNNQLKIFVKNSKYIGCKALQDYSNKIEVK